MSGYSWPEQDIIDAWVERHGIELSHDVLFDLKQSVTELRLPLQSEASRRGHPMTKPHAPTSLRCGYSSHPGEPCSGASGDELTRQCPSCGACVCVRCAVVPCPVCKGVGWYAYTGASPLERSACIACNGTGTLPDPEGPRHYEGCEQKGVAQ